MNPLIHDERGRFKAGHKSWGGRKSKAAERAEAAEYLQAIRDVMTPEGLKEYLQRAAKIAEDNKSSKGMVQVAELIASYSIGKPTQKIEVGSAGDLLALLEEDSTPLLPKVDAEAQVKVIE